MYQNRSAQLALKARIKKSEAKEIKNKKKICLSEIRGWDVVADEGLAWKWPSNLIMSKILKDRIALWEQMNLFGYQTNKYIQNINLLNYMEIKFRNI